MTSRVTILMISGSLRAGSTNTALLNTAKAVAPGGVDAVLYTELGRLPHFNPDDDHEPLHPAVRDLREALGRADALLFSTPEYAGALPGSFKNLLDWTVGGGETYGMPAAWINASGLHSPTGAAGAHHSLRQVLGYTGVDIIEAACVRIPVARQSVGPDGLIVDSTLREQVAGVLEVMATYVRQALRNEK
ncbi:NADPH-dependent FMN reductase [Deinococcus aluminii]|uniref:NAD(P)H-dependent FMN reductase PA1204 n=1 Tax=Deinococcus aluminii TaxID=1656885 RepID=A0ABP9XIP4_9DEIO